MSRLDNLPVICRHCGRPLYDCNHDYFALVPGVEIACPECGTVIAVSFNYLRFADNIREHFCPGCGYHYTRDVLKKMLGYPEDA